MAGDIVKPTDIVNAEQLQQLLGKRNGPGLLFLAVHLATLATSGGLLFLSLGSGWMLPALVLHGIIVVHLFGPFHESSHGTAFRSDWLNKAMGWFSGLVLFLIPHHFRYEHLAHHSYTQNVDEDPQMIPSAERLGGYLFYATAIPYFISNGRIMTRIMLGRLNPMERHFIPKREQAKVIRQARIMWMVYLAAAGLSFGLGSSFLWTYWLLPRLAGEPAMRLVRMSEHTGCPRVEHFLRNTRTVLTWPPVRWLAWNMAYHAEHHALPTTPFFALGDLHGMLGRHFAEVRDGYANTQVHLIRNALEPLDVQHLENVTLTSGSE